MNDLILSNLYLPYLWWLLTGLQLVVYPSYHGPHQNRQLLIKFHFKAFAASSCSVLICLSWVCHSDWQEQIAVVAADAMEPDALPKV
jgi:hypothetical protein